MKHTSEWVSIGHPDKTADYISSYLLDRYIERDPDTRYAVEVQIKDQFVTLGGEVTSKAGLTDDAIAGFVREAVAEIGYTRAYQEKWGRENAICADDIEVASHISRQSPDIALGVDRGGWGDQGIFWGMAENSPATDYMPRDWCTAREIGRRLNFHIGELGAGLDIKTQVTMDGPFVRRAIVAIPLRDERSEPSVAEIVRGVVGPGAEIVVNGTGSFRRHGPLGDCGTTGRKLAVDFYGGNCRLGGGSPWTKDGTKADLTLNLLARHLALADVALLGNDESRVAISCCIGEPEIEIVHMDERMEQTGETTMRVSPRRLVEFFRLDEPRFASMCREGLFSWMPSNPFSVV